MRRWDRILLLTVVFLFMLIVGDNLLMWRDRSKVSGRLYRVEANRVVKEIERHGLPAVSLSDYKTITAVVPFSGKEEEFFAGGEWDYLIRYVAGVYYRIEYRTDVRGKTGNSVFAVNLILAVMGLFLISVLLFVRQNIVKPFALLQELPYELSKGNLTVSVKENKYRFFGRFLWGLDLLRERLEKQRQLELRLQREKKTLLLSLSHDIKTPLSAIKLYGKALSRGLYKEKEKQDEITQKIWQKADEIEAYVYQIVQASREDFLQFEVEEGEFYLSDLLDSLKKYYEDQQELWRIPFEIGDYGNCLLKGDRERSVEVLQNIVENAMKYGDGNVIRIRVEREEDCQLVIVQNSGCTLQEHELPHIFESFWRGSNVKNQSGSGLGLYICRQLMRKMDGEIYARADDGMMLVTTVFRMI